MNTEVNIIANKLIHDLRTPIATIRGSAKAFSNLTEQLINGYILAQNANLLEKKIPARHVEILKNTLNNILHSANEIDAKLDHFNNQLSKL